MHNLVTELARRGPGTKLILMPLARVLVERPLVVGRFRVFPPGYVDLAALRPIRNHTLSHQVGPSGFAHLSGQKLREVNTSLTGFSADALNSNALVAFLADVDWNDFLDASHEDDLETLSLLSATAERALDLVRFYLCRLDLPDTLPGIVGSWNESGPYIGALLYCLEDHESYLIAGAAGGYAEVTAGIGLELDHEEPQPLPSAADGEVGAVAAHALSLLTDAMYSRNDTSKFVRTMTLLEFLANPNEYQNWKKAKGNIACHCTSTKATYLKLLDRFRELTSINGPNGEQRGLRTLLIHHGQFLEEAIPNRTDRRALFRELHGYCSSVIEDMLNRKSQTWIDFTVHRRTLKIALGVADAA